MDKHSTVHDVPRPTILDNIIDLGFVVYIVVRLTWNHFFGKDEGDYADQDAD